MKVIVDGRVLSGPRTAAVGESGRTALPVGAIARAVGATVAVESGARVVNVRRADGIGSSFDAEAGEVRENGRAVLTVNSSRALSIAPTADDLVLPSEIVAALFDVSIRIDEKQGAVIVTSAGRGSSAVNTGASGGSILDIYRVESEYNFSRYSSAGSADALLTSIGRLGDARYYVRANLTGRPARPRFANGSIDVTRPNGQRLMAGDVATGGRLEFLSTSLRGGFFTAPIGGWSVSSFAGKAASGTTPFVTADQIFVPRRVRFDTSIFGGYVTRSVTRRLTASAGGMRFNGSGGSGSEAAGSASYDGTKLRFTADAAFGTFSKGTAAAIDVSATYAVMQSLTFQGRYEHIGANFLSPQRAGHEPVDLKAAGFNWSPRKWMNASVTASTASRPNAGAESSVTAALGIAPGDGRTRLYISHTSISTPVIKGGEFTLLNAATEFHRVHFYANATRVKTIGTTSLSAVLGAIYGITDRQQIEVAHGFGSRGALNGHVDWRSSMLSGKGLSFTAGVGYEHSMNAGLRMDERLTASLRLPHESSVYLNFVRTSTGTALLVQLKTTLFRKRDAAAYIDSSVAAVAKLGGISGRIFQDVNGNGVYDPGVDKPQSGVNVHLDGSRYAITDTNGVYRMDAVTAGLHKAAIDLTSVRADLTILAGQRDIDVAGGKTSNTDFSLVRTGRIAGRVFIDANGNGRFDEGEQPLSDIRIVTSSGRDTLTDSDGAFSIADLAPGDHVVLIDDKSLPEKLVSAAGSLAVKVFEAKETGGVWLPVVPTRAEVKRFTRSPN
jgi:hypothetical protein